MNIPSHKNKSARNLILITTLFSIVYAIIRYNIFGTVPWKDLPLYVLNKGISLSSLILLTITFSLGPLKNMKVKISENFLNVRRPLGIAGFLLSFLHIFMSITILNPKYYKVFFMETGTLTIEGSLSLLGGILSFVFLWVYNTRFSSRINEDEKIIALITSRRFLIYAMFFIGIHLFFMGYKGWGNISGWQAGLPPISLISFIVFLIGFVINLFGRK
jgi:DMSO/TMAO reductase YedYZ heme-binding membrane subunit